ncbi:dienelactone hydrolase family protein [Nocardia sp. CA-084685]|uniref:dienelactone hydrolase family protein n=1 Tax=Nocardia sp. CA-084685 TaxID=3239970 RepID=UPI003D99E6A4
MNTIELDGPDGAVEAILARPSGDGPWPGVVVLHDGAGFGRDIRGNVEMLADYGYLTIAPNLFANGRVRCIRAVMRSLVFTGASPTIREILAARDRLVADPDCTGKTAVIGFCMGGGFALLTAPMGFDASAPFYPGLYGDYRAQLDGACPVVASYAQRDPSLVGADRKLDRALSELGVEHDIKTYPGTTHGFANVFSIDPVLRVAGLGYDAQATRDAWHRILAFFDKHLTDTVAGGSE